MPSPCPSPFSRSAGPTFADRGAVLGQARAFAEAVLGRHPEVRRVLLFGSFVRDDYGPRSDLDLLLVLADEAGDGSRERRTHYADLLPAWPADLFVATEGDLARRLADGDPFVVRVLAEAVELARRPEGGAD